MKSSILLANFANIFLMAVVVEIALAAVFSITAVKDYENKTPVKITKEVVTFLVCFFVCWFFPVLRLFLGTDLGIKPVPDIVITSLVLTRLTGVIRDIFVRLRG
jgi:hypothetical protein